MIDRRGPEQRDSGCPRRTYDRRRVEVATWMVYNVEVPVRILDRALEGMYLVQPTGGKGEVWVAAEALKDIVLIARPIPDKEAAD